MIRLRLSSSVTGLIGLGLLAGLAAPASAQWDQWGGPQRDFVVKSGKLSTSWPEAGPKTVWERKLPGGYSCLLSHGDRLFTMTREGDEEVVLSLNPADGKTIWEHRYSAIIPEEVELRFGKGPNATPLIVGDKMITIGMTGHLACLSLKDGSLIWSKEVISDLGGNMPHFGYSSSPVAFGDNVIVPVGGEGKGLMAFKVADGKKVWSSGDFQNSYSSPIIINVDGQDQVVNFFGTAVVGMNARTGEVLWSHKHENQWKTNIVTPLWGKDNLLYISSGGNASGSRGLKLSQAGGKTTVEEVWFSDKMKIGHTNVVRVGDTVYGSHGDSAMFVTAINMKDGEIAFKERGFAKANMLYADGKLILLDEDGKLALAKHEGGKFQVLCEAQVLKNKAWTVPTLIGTRLFVRDVETIAALDLQ